MPRLEKRAKKALHRARRIEETHRELEARTVAVIDGLRREVETLRAAQESTRHILFGAFLGRALGDEPKLSAAVLAERAEWFRGHEEAPWLLFSAQ